MNSTMNLPPVRISKPNIVTWNQNVKRTGVASLIHPLMTVLPGLNPNSVAIGRIAFAKSARAAAASTKSRG